jgi:hypothetical protein
MKTFLVAALAAAALFAADPAAGRGWWEHVLFLADDKLEGRETGSAGYRKAAEYVAGEFERAGLKAAGVSGYMQPVKFRSLQLEERSSSVAMVRDGVAERLKIGEALLLSASGEAGTVEAEAVFAGYGLKIPEIEYDDLAGLDVRGKMAVFFTGGPENIPGPLLAHAQLNVQTFGFRKTGGILHKQAKTGIVLQKKSGERLKTLRMRGSRGAVVLRT